MSIENVTEQQRRFKHQSYQAQIKNVHLPSPLARNIVDKKIDDDQSHFHLALDQWRQLNLAPAFLHYAKKSDCLSASLPLLLHNWEAVVDLWLDAAAEADLESKQPLLDLLQKLLHDLRTTLTPKHEVLWDVLLSQATRSLPPSTLETYIQTLSLFLKYLLLPEPSNLAFTWHRLAATIKKCRPDVQRMLAEVWATVLRRLKAETRAEMTALLVEALDSIQEAVAWIYIAAFQTTSTMLHTSTIPLLSLLWDTSLRVDNNEAISTLIRRILTATMHYCSPESFRPIAELVSTQIQTLGNRIVEEEIIHRTLQMALIVAALRKGKKAESMFTADEITTILARLATIPLTDRLKDDVCAILVACLKGGEMSIWVRGRGALDHLWEDTASGYRAARALSKLDQSKGSNWKAFMLPYVQRAVLSKGPQYLVETLDLLHGLTVDGRVLFNDEAFSSSVEEICRDVLAQWTLKESSVLQLRDILAIVPVFPELGRPLVGVVDSLIGSNFDSFQDYQATAANAAWCLGSSMLALSTIKGWNDGSNIDAWFEHCLSRYSWSSKVLEGLVSLSHLATVPVSFMEALTALKPAVMSHIGALRYQSLQFLASKAVEKDSAQNSAVLACLQAESVEITSTRTPERVLKTSKLGALTPVGQSPGSTELCIRWLLAQLKVNLMPLWKATAQALIVLFERCGGEVWPVFKAEIDGIFDETRSHTNGPPWASDVSAHDRSYQEHEKTWRNPGLDETLNALDCLGQGMDALVRYQQIQDRFDVENYEKQLLKVLEGSPTYAERHNRDLVPLFLSFASLDLPNRLGQHKLSSWLALFAKFANPKAVYASAALHSIYVSLLSHPERTLQTVAVECLLSYKSKALKTHESTIRGLLDDSQWKEHLMGLDLAGALEPSDRVEFVDFLIRLLYGMIRERRGRNKLQDRRATLLGALRQCADAELGTLVHLMLEPFGMTENQLFIVDFDAYRPPSSLTWKQQVGFLVLQGEVTRLLGQKLKKYWPSLLWATMTVTATAQRTLDGVKTRPDGQLVDDAESDGGDTASDIGDAETPHKVARNLRQLGIKRLTEYFRLAVEFDFSPYLPAAFETFISPRLQALEMENTQSPSAIMELFHAWSAHPGQVEFLVKYDAGVLPKILACLVAANVKPSVVARVLDIVENVFTAAYSNEHLVESVIRPHLSLLIDNLAVMIKEVDNAGAATSEISQRQIHTLRIISDYVVGAQHASSLLPLLLPLLRKSVSKVNESVKVDLLQVVYRLLSLLETDDPQTTTLSTMVYEIVAQLLQTLRSRQARLSAAEVFTALASKEPELGQLAVLIKSLNSYDEHRPEEPDFDRRMEAFTVLNERLYLQLLPHQWLPILHNMLHFIHDQNELSIRSNAAYSMRRFIQMAKSSPSEESQKLFNRVLFTGIKTGLRSKYELVRVELVSVLAFAIKECPDLPFLHDMKPLLADGDEEANFFNNISHVQIHRRTRALRRLSDHCNQGHLRSSTLNDVFAPIVGHYIGDSSLDHLLVNEAIVTMGHIAKQLIWSRYYALVQRYIKSVKDKSSAVKAYVRTVISILDNFHFSMEDVVQVLQQDEEVPEETEGEVIPDTKPSLSLKIADAVNDRLLPALLRFLEKREETEDTMRIPMAVGIAKVALHLPAEKQRLQVTRLMTILCQALRSKSSETRDLTRETLCKIVVSAGKSYLPVLIQELRVALTRGPQLHILAVTCHSLVHHVTNPAAIEKGFTGLDDIAGDVAEISAEVIFGQSGKDVQGEDFKTTFREVRSASSKSLDTLAILARSITLGYVARLLLPLRSIMHETESVKTMQLVEESLKRIAGGLNSNSSLDPKALLSLCHTLIGQNAKFLQETPDIRRKGGGTKKNFVVQSKRDLPRANEHYAHNSFRFVAFGLDLLVVAFRRNRFDYHDAEIISRLEPMVNLIGNTLYSNAAPVVVLGLKAVSAIVKAPLQAIPKALPVVVRQQVEIIRQAGSAESEVAQASLKSLASTLRDCTTAQLKEKDLKFVLEVMEPDLEEVERQAAVFALLRAIIQRKLVVPEIYDMLDRISNVVVTNQSTQVQEMCRGILLQFLLDYPQGRGRLRKQMTFLASNLSYVFESGRISVMILLDAIFQKFEQKLVAEYADMFFAALVMVLANDDSSACRERAFGLIKALYKALEQEQRLQMVQKLHVWATQGAQGPLARISAQVYGLVIDASAEDGRTHLPVIISDLNQMLESAVEQQEDLVNSTEDAMEVDLDWQTSYHALVVLCKSFKSLREVDAIANAISWDSVIDLMVFPHAWVRSACSKLLGSFYASPVNCLVEIDPGRLHPASRHGMVAVAKNSSIQLRSEHLDQAFSLQVVKNLVYVGKAFYDSRGTDAAETDEHNGIDSGNGESSDGDEADQQQKTKEERIVQAPLPWLFSKLSYQVKTAHLKRRNSFAAPKNWHLEPLAILQWFASMVSYLDADGLERYLIHILTPVYRITEDDTIRDTVMDEVKTVAQELQDLVQSKVGITKFTAIYSQIRQGTLAIRRERKAARAMKVASNPQGAAIRQIQRNVAKRESKKRKSHALKETKAGQFPSKRQRVE